MEGDRDSGPRLLETYCVSSGHFSENSVLIQEHPMVKACILFFLSSCCIISIER